MTLNTQPLVGYLERERDLAVARILEEEFARDEDLMASVRQQIATATAVYRSFGGTVTVHDYVMLTLEKLADTLRARHV